MIFNDEYTAFNITFNSDHSILKIDGSIKNNTLYKDVIIIAPNPINRMSNYSGSGLPYPNYEIAFENTPNIHKIEVSGIFNISFKYPNSFYMPDGINKIKPSIYFIFNTIDNKSFRLQYELRDINTLRTLVNRSSRKNPAFYGAKDSILPIATAEKVMLAYSEAKIKNDIG
jgi:hypothetical protein